MNRSSMLFYALLAISAFVTLNSLQALPRLVPQQPLVIASHVWPGYETLFLSDRENWLDKTQVRLQETGSSTQSLQALTDGRVDGAALTLDEVFRAAARGIPLRIVLVFDISAGADVLLVKQGIRTLTGLKQRRIGVEQSAVGALMLSQILKKAQLGKQDVAIVPLTVDQHLDAWQQQKVDALITFEPVASRLKTQRAVTLFDSRQLPDMIVDVLAVREQALIEKPRAVRHLIISHLQALAQLKHNPQDIAFRIAGHLKLSPAQIGSEFNGLILPDLTNNYRLLTGTHPKLLDSATRLQTVMRQEGLLNQEQDLHRLIRSDFLPPQEFVNAP